jgi:transcriptional regulator with XRE-family HTH domain
MMKNKKIDPRFGQWLRKRRRSIDMTLEELSKRIGLDAPRLSRIEHGLQRPPMPKLASQIAKALGVNEASPEYQELLGYLVEDRLKLVGFDQGLEKFVRVRIHGPVGVERRAPQAQPPVRIKENPRQVYGLEAAAHRVVQNIQLEGGTVEKARLLVKDSKNQEWEFDVILPDDRRKKAVLVKHDRRKFPPKRSERR